MAKVPTTYSFITAFYDPTIKDTRSVTVNLEVDFQKIANQLAYKAYRSKNKTARALKGAIVVKAPKA